MASNDNAKPEGEAGEEKISTAETAEPAKATEEAAPGAAEAAETELADSAATAIAALEAEKAELKEQLLRSLAEVENVRRRAQRERENAAHYASEPLAKDLLAVRDNLCRAVECVSAEAAEAEPQLKALLEGVVMTEKGLSEAFARHHVEIIDPLGEKFDPNLHDAMFEVPDSSQPAGTVAQVIEVGYRLHDRLLRAARVGVVKAAPAVADAASSAPPAGEATEEEKPGGAEGAAKPGQQIDTAV